MPAWWDSLETMAWLSSWAKTIGFGLGLVTALCTAVIFFSGRRVEALKAKREADRHLSAEQRTALIAYLQSRDKGSVLVHVLGDDAESGVYARELVETIRGGGWDAKIRIHLGIEPFSRGLVLVVHSPETPPPNSVYLQQAILLIDPELSTELTTISEPTFFEEGEIALKVGRKRK